MKFSRTQNKATTRHRGIFCGWSVRLEQSTTAQSFRTYIINFQKHAQDASFSRSYFTDCFAEYEQRTLYGAHSDSSLVTAPYKLSFYYYFFLSSVSMFSREV